MANLRKYRAIRAEIRELTWQETPADTAQASAKQERINTLRAELQSIEAIIDGLPDPDERTALRLRYLSGYSWLGVSRRMYMSRSSVFRLAKRAQVHYVESGGTL